MENNILNALDFLLKSDQEAQEALDNGYDISRRYSDKEWLFKMVAYAASVHHEVVVPPVSQRFGMTTEYAYSNGFNKCLYELRRLNPTLTFTELNHNAPTGDKSDEG